MSRYAPPSLVQFTEELFYAYGMSALQSEVVARHLVEADLYGHRSHGVALAELYVTQLKNGGIRPKGRIDVLAESDRHFAWDADGLPGPWVVHEAIAKILDMALEGPSTMASIGSCSHVGALLPFLVPFVDRGLFVLLTATNPGIASVAPFGGLDPVTTTNPIAVGIPTGADPILIDQCCSVISNSTVAQHSARGEDLPDGCLQDGFGRAANSPAVLSHTPRGTILPLGGKEFGYKGFALTLVVEALALGLSGYGRTADPGTSGEGMFLLAIDPGEFAGSSHFEREMLGLRRATERSRPQQEGKPPRLPGDLARRLHEEQLVDGIELGRSLVKSLTEIGSARDITFPKPVTLVD